MKVTALFLALLTSFWLFIPLAYADRGLLPITDVDVYGPGQKAIIAWNGRVERLVLSTDLFAAVDTKVLEVLPLPSMPSVERGSFASFETVQNLMMKNMPRAGMLEHKGGLEVVLHERIGAHDITVVKATSVEELIRFMFNYTKKMTLPTPIVAKGAHQIMLDYLARGFNYWVFDLVDLYATARSIEPIIYEFQSSSLYYPMKISATAKGNTKIILYLITSNQIDESAIPSKMQIARYLPNEHPIQFQIMPDELVKVEQGLGTLFPILLVYPPRPVAWLTAVKYEGDLNDLDFDLEIPPRSAPCRSIEVTTDRYNPTLRETVQISIDFIHLTSGCSEIAVIHTHQIRAEIFDLSGNVIQSWKWNSDSELHKTVFWKPDKLGDYTIKASSFWNGEQFEVDDKIVIRVSDLTPTPTPHPTSTPVPTSPFNLEIQWLLYGVIIAVAGILIGAGITYLLLKSRLK